MDPYLISCHLTLRGGGGRGIRRSLALDGPETSLHPGNFQDNFKDCGAPGQGDPMDITLPHQDDATGVGQDLLINMKQGRGASGVRLFEQQQTHTWNDAPGDGWVEPGQGAGSVAYIGVKAEAVRHQQIHTSLSVSCLYLLCSLPLTARTANLSLRHASLTVALPGTGRCVAEWEVCCAECKQNSWPLPDPACCSASIRFRNNIPIQ